MLLPALLGMGVRQPSAIPDGPRAAPFPSLLPLEEYPDRDGYIMPPTSRALLLMDFANTLNALKLYHPTEIQEALPGTSVPCHHPGSEGGTGTQAGEVPVSQE